MVRSKNSAQTPIIQYAGGLNTGILRGRASKIIVKYDDVFGSISDAPYNGANEAPACEGVIGVVKKATTAMMMGAT